MMSLLGSTDSFVSPKEEVFVEMSLYTDAYVKLQPDCNPPKLEPNINMDGGMFFFISSCITGCQDRVLHF